jgi:hypothetical protein
MYKTTRNIAGDTFMTCKDCGHAISMNKICESPIRSATDILKHMAAHNASRAFAVAAGAMSPKPDKAISSDELSRTLSALEQQVIASGSQLTN